MFHLTLSSFLLGLSIFSYVQDKLVSVNALPFSYADTRRNIALLGAAGLCCSLLALTRWFKFFFVVWTLLALYWMVKWFFLSPETTLSRAEAHGAAWLIFGALGAFLGAAWGFRLRKRLGLV